MSFLSTANEQLFLNVAGFAVFAAIWLYSFAFKAVTESSGAKAGTQKLNIYQKLCTGVVILAFVSLTISLAIRGIGLGHMPIRNLYESLVIFVWGLLGSYLVLEWKYEFRKFGAYVSMLAMGIFLYASWLPMSQKDWSPLIPALQSYWRAIHVPPLLVSYALFLLAAIASVAYLISERKAKPDKKKLEFYEAMTYRCVTFGFPLLTFGIICGALWANHAWGALWQWDPKETLALFTWFVYGAYLHLRMNGANATRTSWLSVAGLAAVYITYMGINQFGFGGLHSYGNIE